MAGQDSDDDITRLNRQMHEMGLGGTRSKKRPAPPIPVQVSTEEADIQLDDIPMEQMSSQISSQQSMGWRADEQPMDFEYFNRMREQLNSEQNEPYFETLDNNERLFQKNTRALKNIKEEREQRRQSEIDELEARGVRRATLYPGNRFLPAPMDLEKVAEMKKKPRPQLHPQRDTIPKPDPDFIRRMDALEQMDRDWVEFDERKTYRTPFSMREINRNRVKTMLAKRRREAEDGEDMPDFSDPDITIVANVPSDLSMDLQEIEEEDEEDLSEHSDQQSSDEEEEQYN